MKRNVVQTALCSGKEQLVVQFFSSFSYFFLFLTLHTFSFVFLLPFFQQHAYLNVNTFFHSIANKKVTQTFIHFFLFTLVFMYTRLRSKENHKVKVVAYSTVFSFSAISNCRKYQKNAETTKKNFSSSFFIIRELMELGKHMKMLYQLTLQSILLFCW